MAVGAAFLEYILEQLERAGRITSRRMFGAVGLYCDDTFFAVIDDDTLYFKVDDVTRPEYQARGMKPFVPYKDKPEVSMNYYTVPADVLDDAEELVKWAKRSASSATRRSRASSAASSSSASRARPRPRRKH